MNKLTVTNKELYLKTKPRKLKLSGFCFL